jgi:hypothetical protein
MAMCLIKKLHVIIYWLLSENLEDTYPPQYFALLNAKYKINTPDFAQFSNPYWYQFHAVESVIAI